MTPPVWMQAMFVVVGLTIGASLLASWWRDVRDDRSTE